MIRGPDGMRKECMRVRNSEYFLRRYFTAKYTLPVSYKEATMLSEFQVYYWVKKIKHRNEIPSFFQLLEIYIYIYKWTYT